MPIALSLQTQITAIKNRIDAVASTATPEDIVMLAKAVESIGGQVTVFDVMAEGEAKLAAIQDSFDTNIAAGVAAVNASAVSNVAAVNAAKDAALAVINPSNYTLAAVHAASLSI